MKAQPSQFHMQQHNIEYILYKMTEMSDRSTLDESPSYPPKDPDYQLRMNARYMLPVMDFIVSQQGNHLSLQEYNNVVESEKSVGYDYFVKQIAEDVPKNEEEMVRLNAVVANTHLSFWRRLCVLFEESAMRRPPILSPRDVLIIYKIAFRIYLRDWFGRTCA
jgi:hypothetical protein